ncbi:MAG TPA: Stp1/IreP family PP2C-type Ser/Thr phosphatase [Gaiellaceae bacterium]
MGQKASESNPGRKRRRNEDTPVCDPPLFAVADGMGGAQAGEIASSLAAAALRERDHDDSGRDGEERVAELIQEANRRVHQRAIDDESASGMGTTMTVALFEPDGSVAIGHVGDSRAYLLREAKLEQLTEDHSLVAELVRRGELSPEEAEVHPQRSVITRALGTDPNVDVDTFTVQARENDVFLICSDGLTTMVDVDTITSILDGGRHDLVAAARALVKEANERGGDDNITVVMFEVAEGEPDDETRETPAIASPDEDTLHPEPSGGGGFDDGDTAIVSVEDIRSALEAERGDEEAAEETPRASLVQYAFAGVLILALVGLVVFLVVRGLAR